MTQVKDQPQTFRARLTEAGLAVEDTTILCSEFTKIRDWKQVRQHALRENLLGKGSAARISKLLRAVERRVIDAQPPMACHDLLARFLASNVSDAAKAQLLFVLATREDLALAEAYRHFVAPSLSGIRQRAPDKNEIVAFLAETASFRPEVAQWTAQTRLRWAEGFRLVLREVGIFKSAKDQFLTQLVPRAETICLLCHAVADGGAAGWQILRHEVVQLLLPTDVEAVRAARALEERGWWTLARSNELVEFRRNQPSLEEWLNHVVGP